MTKKEISNVIMASSSVLIFSHNRPDGDTIGCGLALFLALKSVGKNVQLICSNDIPEKYKVIDCVSYYKKLEEIHQKFDLHISVDCSTTLMIKENYDLYSSIENTINIDHHISNTRFAKYNYVKECGACCENVFEIIRECGIKIEKQIADCLLLGICTDTGNFAHSNVTYETLHIASELVKVGGDIHKINEAMFKSQPIERSKLFIDVISNMKCYLEDRLIIITVTKDLLEKNKASRDMTEGFIDYPMSIKTCEVAISLMEMKRDSYKISFRSRGKVNVNEVAVNYGGGGHILASGAMINANYYEIIDKLVFDIKQRL